MAQETEYTSPESRGKIPEEFITKSSQKYEEAQDQINRDGSKRDKDLQSDFYLQSNFGVDRMLRSGVVMFNDTIGSYTARVLDIIREYDHSVSMALRVYTIKSPVVNAFSTDQGIIFITSGLIAQLENEAQLAFILCHEIAHYQKGHVLQGYIEESKMLEERRFELIDKELTSAKYSRDQESEADELGLKMYLKTPYQTLEPMGVFDVLLYSYLPFDELPFDSSILIVGDYSFPQKLFTEEINPIEEHDDEDDSKSTHPNIAKRRKAAMNTLDKYENTGKKYIVSKEDFKAVRKIARFEVLRLQLIQAEYDEAIYSAFILHKEFPESELPELAIGEALFGMAMFSNAGSLSKVIRRYKKVEGNS